MKGKYLCEDTILECEEEEVDEEVLTEEDVAEIETTNSDEDEDELNPDDFTFDQWMAQAHDDSSQEDGLNLNESLEVAMDQDALTVDPDVQVSAERIDVFCEGKSVRPLDDDEKGVLSRLRAVFFSKAKESVPSLKSRNRLEVEKQLRLVNGLAGNLSIECCSISDVNHLLYACSLVVAERLGMKKKNLGGRKEKEDPWWKRRIEKKIKDWRKDLSRIDELRRRNWKPTEGERTRMNKLYDLDCKGANEVCALLKSKIYSSSIKVKRYVERKIQFHQNTLFKNSQSKLYEELNGKSRGNVEAPKAKEATKFWSDIWSKPGIHAEDAEWLGRVKGKLCNVEKQNDLLSLTLKWFGQGLEGSQTGRLLDLME